MFASVFVESDAGRKTVASFGDARHYAVWELMGLVMDELSVLFFS